MIAVTKRDTQGPGVVIGITNRDIAFLVWLGAFIVFVAWKRDTRRSLLGVLQAVRGKILVLLLAYIAYIAAVVAVAWRLGLWNSGLLKDTIAWLIVPGLALLFGFTKAYEERRFCIRTLARVVGLTALVEFYVNVVSFPLWIELVLLPAAAFLVLLSAVASMKPDTEVVRRWADRVLGVVAVAVIVATGANLAGQWDVLDKPGLALLYVQPAWLTLAGLPFVFVFSLLANYEEQFVRIGFNSKDDPRARRRAKLALVQSFHVTDWEGRPLDKREFDETKDALDHLGLFHAGQFKEGRYRRDLLSVVAGIDQGIPRG